MTAVVRDVKVRALRLGQNAPISLDFRLIRAKLPHRKKRAGIADVNMT
jgi:hypothetical protein